MRTPSPNPAGGRSGITLLEVLIAMFVLALGILSIFALFTAGRELESRAAIKSNAAAFAAAQGQTLGSQWLDWRQWLRVDNPVAGTFRWAKPDPGGLSPVPIVLPVIVDPWGVCELESGESFRSAGNAWETAPDPAVYWDWSRFVPLTSALRGAAPVNEPFQRVTLPATPRPQFLLNSPLINPLDRESTLTSFSDEDSVEYRLSPDPNAPPLNVFERGRRKRGTDLVPALFIAAANPATNAVAALTPVRRSLLVFHKPVADFETTTGAPPTSWPSGMVELRVTRHGPGLIEATLSQSPSDEAVVRRSLRPGKWVLFTNRLPRTGGPSYHYDTAWREMTSVTRDQGTGSWLIMLRNDLDSQWPTTPEPSLQSPPGPPIATWTPAYPDSGSPQTDSPIYCYAFEHLVHVEELAETTLPP